MVLKLFLILIIATSRVLADEASCVLPSYPEHGSYKVTNEPNAEPGKALDNVHLNITCNAGYDIVGKHSAFCVHGIWSNDIPKCVHTCRLNQHPSITYNCIVDDVQGTRKCSDREPDGTVVIPKCNEPLYYTSGLLPNMKCIDGSWDYVASCQAECGKVIPQGESLKRSIPSDARQMPWYAAIYTKTTEPYMQICGGSLISPTVVISAAHCFWNDVHKLKPVSDYAVAVGKVYRRWNDPQDTSAQKSDVKEIKIPLRFHGDQTNYQEDISLVFVTTPFRYTVHVRPVCLDFDVIFDRRQLENEKVGIKVAGWNLQEQQKVLKIVDMKNIDVQSCIAKMPPSFGSYITSDKICGEILPNKLSCRGYGGAGMVVPDTDGGENRYYLRGVLSTAPQPVGENSQCNLVAITHVLKHEQFIKSYLM